MHSHDPALATASPTFSFFTGALHLGKCPAIFLLDQYVLQAGVHGWVYGMVTIGNNFRESEFNRWSRTL